MHLILTGATGLVGSGVLDAMIKRKDITKISILSRRPVKMAEDSKDPRVNVILHKDFEKYDAALLSQLQGATGCVWALGISQTQVGPEEYVKITKDYALEASKAFQHLATETRPFNFVYVSGYGASTKPGRFAPIFARVKGQTELALADMRKDNPVFHASSVRPCFVDAARHDAIKPFLTEKITVAKMFEAGLGPFIRLAYRSMWSPTFELGDFLAEMAMGKHQGNLAAAKDVEMVGRFPILENSAFRRMAGLDSK
ncbi:putative nucleoside-diphosphate-sugar epimerase [Xylariomycetidae sp. FL2044]|nr:putative nucleoside-diphosphate-sugar epimerase [Xylariomycetidae sp. FL2044]